MLKTFEEMCDDESICKYCAATDYGDYKSCHTPNGYYMCEGTWCEEAYDAYLEEEETSFNIVKYASCVKLTNEEDFYGK